LRTLNVGPGDEVICPAFGFSSPAEAIARVGATPVFVDVRQDSYTLDPDKTLATLTQRTKAIIPVHLAGWPCDMDSIVEFANAHGIKVIEDCAQAHGATHRGRPVGSFGHAAAFSFCQDKIITTGGEGGMLMLNDETAWEKAWAFKDHGKSFDAVYRRKHPAGFRWLHDSFGTNWRLTEMQAAIGRIQLGKLAAWVAQRRENAAILNAGFSAMPALRVTLPAAEIGHAYYKYYVFVRPERLRREWGRDRIMQAINDAGVPCFSGSCSEIYLEKAFDGVASRPAGRLPVAGELGDTSLMFLVHPALGAKQMRHTVDAVAEVMRSAGN